MKVAIIPFSSIEQSESLPVYRYFKAQGAEITAFYYGEPELPQDIDAIKIEKTEIVSGLEEFDLVVRGPSIHPNHIASAKKTTTLMNLFFEHCPANNIIGVTGTKGKGTTSTLISKMLEAAGKKVWLGGNIGRPLLDNIKEIQQDDWVVLELANFQLIDLKYSPHIAVCLMVVAEHMDWHTDMDEYVKAKQQLFLNQTKDDIAIYNSENENSLKVASASSGQKIPFMQAPGANIDNGAVVINDQEICKISELKLLGRHNWQNACAAVTAVWQVSQDIDAMRKVLTTFAGLEHRLELVRELDGVKYYDDSFGTTPETALVAIEAFEQPKIVILGGSDKGASYDNLAKTVSNNDVSKVLLIGAEAPRIQRALEKVGFRNFMPGGDSMVEIVSNARAAAKPGGVVLLSTGCASFGMFKNYKDRGEQFKKAVLALS